MSQRKVAAAAAVSPHQAGGIDGFVRRAAVQSPTSSTPRKRPAESDTDDDVSAYAAAAVQSPTSSTPRKRPAESDDAVSAFAAARRAINRLGSDDASGEHGPTEQCAGAILSLELENFMCHRKFHIQFVRNVCRVSLRIGAALTCVCVGPPAQQHDVCCWRKWQW
jgi:hypothetical protein